MTNLGPKAIAALRLASVPSSSLSWDHWYALACSEFSEKALIRTMERLADRGYLEYGVSARTAWLTDKGRAALKAIEEGSRP